MKVSVVVCTYSMERFSVFCDAVDSVLRQDHAPLEVVLVIDGNEEVHRCTLDAYGDEDRVSVHANERNRGISYSRTRGAELASGEVVAFIDDDAEAAPDWIGELVRVYEETDAVAVGGQVLPEWMAGKPAFFPEEFYWLVGCDERGFGEHMEELRNTYGPNISYRRDVFLAAGGYDERTGRKGDRHIQAHEAPVCIRIRDETGRGVVYNKEAVVHHKLFAYKGEFRWLLGRSFWQGYSKHILDRIVEDTYGSERDYLARVFLRYVPERVGRLARRPSLAEAQQLAAIFVFTAAVGAGYGYARVVDVLDRVVPGRGPSPRGGEPKDY